MRSLSRSKLSFSPGFKQFARSAAGRQLVAIVLGAARARLYCAVALKHIYKALKIAQLGKKPAMVRAPVLKRWL